MGDTNNTADTKDVDTSDTGADDQSDSTTEDGADTSQNNDANDADGGDDTDGDDADDAEDGDDDGTGSSDDDTTSTDTADDDTADDADDGSEPEMRKPKAGASNAEWAAWRKQQAAKADAGKSGKSGDDTDGEDTDSGGDQNDAIAKEVAKQLAPFQQKAAEQEVESEIASFLANNPDFKPFEAKAKRFAMHPSRAQVPIKSIFYEVAGDKLLAIGAKRRAEADKKAKATRTGGGSPQSGEQGSKSYKDMPLDDFGKELEAAKLAPRK